MITNRCESADSTKRIPLTEPGKEHLFVQWTVSNSVTATAVFVMAELFAQQNQEGIGLTVFVLPSAFLLVYLLFKSVTNPKISAFPEPLMATLHVCLAGLVFSQFGLLFAVAFMALFTILVVYQEKLVTFFEAISNLNRDFSEVNSHQADSEDVRLKIDL